MKLEKRVAIVSGAGRGIGRASAETFAREGAHVYALDLDFPEPFAGSIEAVELDVTSLDGWLALVDRIVAEHGRLDVLMNNAGTVTSYDGVADVAPDLWDKVIALNQTAVFYGMKAAIPPMLAGGRGSIINVSSIWGIVGAAGVAPYQASKGAVRLMTKNVAITYATQGIRANSIHPGLVATPLIAAQDDDITAAVVGATPMARQGLPDEIATGALFLAGDDSSFMTGAELVIDGGYTAQ